MIYKHYKGGLYDFIGVAHAEATLDPVVVYQSVEDGTLWTRPASEFFGMVATDPKEGERQQAVRRFAPVRGDPEPISVVITN